MKMSNITKTNKKSQSGFTLVELSIVLVIIGLIISSVLVGQDLVRSAELRAAITQLEGFNAAVGTFRGKYNGLPGDVAGAANFGFPVGNGDNNGILYAANSATGLDGTRENTFFWNHLGSTGAALIAGSYAGSTAVTAANISGSLPTAKAGNYWGVYAGSTAIAAEQGTNFYILGVLGGVGGAYLTSNTLTPIEAKNMDDKVDDGKPGTGIVRAKVGHATNPDTDPVAGTGYETSSIGAQCTADLTVAATPTYAAAVTAGVAGYSTKGTTALCNLRFKMN